MKKVSAMSAFADRQYVERMVEAGRRSRSRLIEIVAQSLKVDAKTATSMVDTFADERTARFDRENPAPAAKRRRGR
ncbi:MAG: hypothetical protein IT534_06950 [Bauldia sp.]|nr:hypothetical protein [Bauldia sp.]